MAGYLYALPVGLWPADIQAFELMSLWPINRDEYRLHVKLGSSTRTEMVDRLHNRYGTPLGRPQLWWAEPSANAARDERSELFFYFKDRRVWRDREIFWFESKEEFDTMISKFIAQFRLDTQDEENDKPENLATIDRRISAEENRRLTVAKRKEQRIKDKEQEKEDHEKHMIQGLDNLILDKFEKSTNDYVSAKLLNQLLRDREIKVKSVRDAMAVRGFTLTAKKHAGKSFQIYTGLKEAVVVCE